MIDVNALGKRGENIVFLALTELYEERPYFRPIPLDAKWPVADFLVELDDEPGKIFLLQVKTTQSDLRADSISIDVDEVRLAQLLGAVVPAYVVAVHEPSKKAYIAVPSDVVRLRSLPIKHDLAAQDTLLALRDEVDAFWQRQSPFLRSTSRFLF